MAKEGRRVEFGGDGRGALEVLEARRELPEVVGAVVRGERGKRLARPGVRPRSTSHQHRRALLPAYCRYEPQLGFVQRSPGPADADRLFCAPAAERARAGFLSLRLILCNGEGQLGVSSHVGVVQADRDSRARGASPDERSRRGQSVAQASSASVGAAPSAAPGEKAEHVAQPPAGQTRAARERGVAHRASSRAVASVAQRAQRSPRAGLDPAARADRALVLAVEAIEPGE